MRSLNVEIHQGDACGCQEHSIQNSQTAPYLA